ncbi:MAG: PD-(D/E)XK nuclease family protein, partial [Rhodobacterales bacterium]|nr:PD-(D/E)XK nuclease family protein [Rhodobacterales bacterium]
EAAATALAGLEAEAPHGGPLTPADFDDLLTGVLQGIEVRDGVRGHPLIRFLGPREAREVAADVILMGGLNDGSWPQLPGPDPWLNRQMRQAAGLRLPERQVGLAAHDFQQAIAAPQVVLTRALRDAEAETIPSRWLNRLMNLLTGLPGRDGPQALAQMRDRGRLWLDRAAAMDRPAAPVPAAPRPSPRPPVADRPRELAVTGISRLIRDPYAIYARHILRLYPLDPLRHRPDARLRGSVLHQVLERFVRDRPADEDRAAARARLLSTAARVLADEVPWPATRALWLARLDRAADSFLAGEAAREGIPVMIEDRGRITLDPPGFTLTARPDRIDRLPDGRLHILDYKTGTPPTERQQRLFDKQLLLEAAMAERGAFAALGRADVARITYVGLGAAGKVETTAITPDLTAQVWEDLARLIARYLTPDQGYTARRALFSTRDASDYDHLSRFGEWDTTDTPQPQDVP